MNLTTVRNELTSSNFQSTAKQTSELPTEITTTEQNLPTETTLPSSSQIQTSQLFFPNGSLDWELVQAVFATHTEDLTGCLVNCSNHGKCILNNQSRLVCVCSNNFVGSSCQIDSDPCSAGPCLNNAECLPTYNSSSKEYNFTCRCGKFHYGSRCENKIDLCANRTCSGNGRCVVNSSYVPACECYKMFSGINCEVQTPALLKIRQVISTASIIAIATLVLTYLIIIIMDLHSFFTNKRQKPKSKAKPKVVSFTYKP